MNTFARTALLTLALATTGFVPEASAQSPLFQWLGHMPMHGGVLRLDRNRDGRVDAILYDTNADGWVEAIRMDSDFDGWMETVALDVDRNGVFNELFFDNDQNGSLEIAVVDRNQDSRFDVVGFDRQGYGYFQSWSHLASNGSVNNALVNQSNQNFMNFQMMQQLNRNLTIARRVYP